MINRIEKKSCCGCSACVQKCPKQCISMSEDEEGFIYPHIDASLCIDCGLCEKVCPVINQAEPRLPKECFAAYNLDENVRKESSSGGVFTLIAEKVIREGGVVFGATWNDRWQVVHTYTDSIEGLAQFRGSKYIQSIIGESYKQAEGFLKDGHKVLFSGTPCQIAGLKLFLRKKYDNLITVDFICHGVPSPGVFRWYLQEELNEIARQGKKNTVSLPTIHSIPEGDVHCPDGFELKGIRFRDKCTGWKKFSFALDLAKATADGEKIQFSLSKDLNKHPFLRGFLWDLYLRPSCSDCKVKSLSSGADITIGDFWGVESLIKKYKDNKGTSCVIFNTENASKYFTDLKYEKTEVNFQSIVTRNPAIVESTPKSSVSNIFWSLHNIGFSERVKVVTHESFNKRAMKVLKAIYYNLYVKPFKL